MRKPDDTGPNPLQWFLSELDQRPGCERTKEMVRDLLRGMAGQRLFITRRDLTLSEFRRVARALLDAGFTPSQAKAELSARTGLRRSQACVYVMHALSQRAEELAIERMKAST